MGVALVAVAAQSHTLKNTGGLDDFTSTLKVTEVHYIVRETG
jgi:hypothetical protein